MFKEQLKSLIIKAKGMKDSQLVLKNANIINVFTGEIIEGDVAIDNGRIVGIGQYHGEKEIDLKGKYLSPGFIDSHVHIESSMSSPSQFAKVILPRGVTTIIADPHEIANVKGIEGIRYIIDDSKNTPLDVRIMLPSCVPATDFENSGSILEAEDLEELLDEETIIGLGEMMNYPGVISGNDKVLDKLTLFKDKVIDGHGPMIKEKDLNAYIVAGIKTEHECSTVEEVLDRIRLGMYVLIREGSAAKDLRNIIKAVNKDNLRRFLFCTDDRHPEDLINEGSIDFNIKLAISLGIDPVDAIIMATLNPSECYGLKGKGAIAPGYIADLVVIDNLKDFNIINVFKNGNLVAENNKALFESKIYLPESMTRSVKIKDVKIEDIQIPMKTNRANIIGVIEDSLVTEKVVKEVSIDNGYFKFSNEDILKMVVIERHFATGNIGAGLIENFKLKDGAIGSTIGHDSHNMIVVGDNDEDILTTINELKNIGGGLTIVSKGEVIKSLPLEIGGIMTSRPIEETNAILKEMIKLSHERLNINKNIDPFMTLAFMALPVIPKVKLTDMGLFDVEKFDFIKVYNED
ncbi:Adenine deaminase [Tissierella praeacuta DSM 18095]|uniref:Adenine deaminase n=1 Tax=Tissierella praeacuta DSM 18095 TaxID=1123404 RepID=A0A1M4YYP4_9FIRM|nr:adenine deaminase [Tissierella praeacuta]SHF10939.1 Adenine deaminase [Tissierella praeacuta DSM 18095]SUP04921.1 Adenine deaminase [Tissierella praeacuta]